MQPIKVILNPYSGRTRGGKAKEQIRAALQKAGVRFNLAETTGVGHGIELARQARMEGYATVVAAGGDGTVSEVMNGLAQATPPGEAVGKLAVLPVGTGNDFAAMAGCPLRLEQAAQTIATGRVRQLDLGYAVIQTAGKQVKRYFDNNLGVGFEAWVTLESYKLKRLSGTALYVAAALRALWSYQMPHIEVDWQTAEGKVGRRAERLLLISIGNSRRTGGGFYLTPNAEMDDGFLDMGIATAVSRPYVLKLLPRALQGKHVNDPAFSLLRVCQVQIACQEALPVHLDGEVVARSAEKVEIGIEPKRLEVIV